LISLPPRGEGRGGGIRNSEPLNTGGPFIADFACLHARLVVELDGGQHTEQMVEDSRRTAYLAEHGFRVLRFWNHQVFSELDDVLETIWLALTSPHTFDRLSLPEEEVLEHACGWALSDPPTPTLPSGGREIRG
jgi:hypothetical protein